MTLRRLVTRPVLVASAVAGGSMVGAAAGSVAAAAWFARQVLTPDALQPDDVLVLDHDADSVTLSVTPETVVDGRYGLWLDGGLGHARVGSVIELTDGGVRRELLGVDRGELHTGPARWNQYYYWDRPSVTVGIPEEEVTITSDVGPLPAWVVRPEDGGGGDWAVLVHGRGARRAEVVRALPVLRELGWTCLVPGYRNDRDSPRGPDGRYTLGLSEWRDIEAAMAWAVSHGAERILLMGWSMGGAIALQVIDSSALADRVVGVVLDSAVLDWADVFAHHGRRHRVPHGLVRLSQSLMGSATSKALLGLLEPVDVARTDWVARAGELHLPMLVMHSDDDDFVPIGPALALAARRPDIVQLERWQVARHCKMWNVDSDRWESDLRSFVSGV
ncbi:MAG: alpha/beta fold hydrolase [Terracoccus sp.]